MVTDEHARRLDVLDAYVLNFERRGKNRRQFWERFGDIAGELEQLVFTDGAEPELSERYCEILANADGAGFACPEELLDEVME